MSRMHDPTCKLERDTRQRMRDGMGWGYGCGHQSPRCTRSCTAPSGHTGDAHICTAADGRVIIMRWTTNGAIQEAEDSNWHTLADRAREENW